MNNEQNPKKYDLEERTYLFAQRCRDFIKLVDRNLANLEYGKQLVRSSGSVAANYIEANESLSKKDFLMRIKICRKEAKESRLWIKLCSCATGAKRGRVLLMDEATELVKIFNAIVYKSN